MKFLYFIVFYSIFYILYSIFYIPTVLAADTPPVQKDHPTLSSSGAQIETGWNYLKLTTSQCSYKNLLDELQADGGTNLKLDDVWIFQNGSWVNIANQTGTTDTKISSNTLIALNSNQRMFFDLDPKVCQNPAVNVKRNDEIELIRKSSRGEQNSSLLGQLLSVPQGFWMNLLSFTGLSKTTNIPSPAVATPSASNTDKLSATDLSVTDKLNAGLLWLDAVEGSINSISTLKLQNNLGGGVDILSGKVTIDNQGTLSANKINLKQAIGKAVLKKGEFKVVVPSDQVTKDSLIFITPTTVTDQVLSVTSQNPAKDFTVEIKGTSLEDIDFNWWIIN